MTLRRLIFEDFGLKLFSLGVALLIWTAVHIAVRKEADLALLPFAHIDTRTFPSRPVLVVSQATGAPPCKVRPSHVEVTIRGDSKMLENLKEHDFHAIVDLASTNGASSQRRRVEVSTPAGLTLEVRATPEEVEVIFPK